MGMTQGFYVGSCDKVPPTSLYSPNSPSTWVQGLGFGFQGLGLRVQALGLMVEGSGFRVQGLGVGGSGIVSGLRFVLSPWGPEKFLA